MALASRDLEGHPTQLAVKEDGLLGHSIQDTVPRNEELCPKRMLLLQAMQYTKDTKS
jgi:hypothetical protein